MKPVLNPPSKAAIICREKFLHYFPQGFRDKKYEAWERNYKWDAHLKWEQELPKHKFEKMLSEGLFIEIANRAIKIETKTNLLFSFEKMALRDGVKDKGAAKEFSIGLFKYIHDKVNKKGRFEDFSQILNSLPRKQTRVRTWPLQTVFGFIAEPEENIFVKPMVTRKAAEKYQFDIDYKSLPNWETYLNIVEFAKRIRVQNKDLHPKDYIDLQSFIWVLGSSEYPD